MLDIGDKEVELAISLEDAIVSGDYHLIMGQLESFSKLGRSIPAAEIANLYEVGNDRVAPSLARALEWYQRSVELEHDKIGYFGMARLYLDGRGVKKM